MIYGIAGYVDWRNDQELAEHSKYTIGTIDRISHFDNGEPLAEISFNYQSKVIQMGAYLGSDIDRNHKKGDRLYVQFSPQKPKEFFKVLETPDVSGKATAPDEGWDKLPI